MVLVVVLVYVFLADHAHSTVSSRKRIQARLLFDYRNHSKLETFLITLDFFLLCVFQRFTIFTCVSKLFLGDAHFSKVDTQLKFEILYRLMHLRDATSQSDMFKCYQQQFWFVSIIIKRILFETRMNKCLAGMDLPFLKLMSSLGQTHFFRQISPPRLSLSQYGQNHLKKCPTLPRTRCLPR